MWAALSGLPMQGHEPTQDRGWLINHVHDIMSCDFGIILFSHSALPSSTIRHYASVRHYPPQLLDNDRLVIFSPALLT